MNQPLSAAEQWTLDVKLADARVEEARAEHAKQLAERESERSTIHANWSSSFDKVIEALKVVCIAAIVASVPVLLGRAVYCYNTHPDVLANTEAYDDMRAQRDAALVQARGLVEALRQAAPPAQVETPNQSKDLNGKR